MVHFPRSKVRTSPYLSCNKAHVACILEKLTRAPELDGLTSFDGKEKGTFIVMFYCKIQLEGFEAEWRGMAQAQ